MHICFLCLQIHCKPRKGVCSASVHLSHVSHDAFLEQSRNCYSQKVEVSLSVTKGVCILFDSVYVNSNMLEYAKMKVFSPFSLNSERTFQKRAAMLVCARCIEWGSLHVVLHSLHSTQNRKINQCR